MPGRCQGSRFHEGLVLFVDWLLTDLFFSVSCHFSLFFMSFLGIPASFDAKSAWFRFGFSGRMIGQGWFCLMSAGVWRILKKEKLRSWSFSFFGWLVGLEPTTFRTTIWRSNQLNYSHHFDLLQEVRRACFPKAMQRYAFYLNWQIFRAFFFVLF